MPDPEEVLAQIARLLGTLERFLMLPRFAPRQRYAEEDGGATRSALMVDVETTGLDPASDRIIQFAGVPFRYDPLDGRIYEVGQALVCLEDPGRPIPPEVTRLTGLSDADVAGQRLDDDAIEALLRTTDLVVAHNAAFDRPFLERRLPHFGEKPWACCMAEVPWRDAGYGSAKLEWLLFKHGGEFYGAHRADADCHAAIHLLATPLPSGALPMQVLLESCRRPMVRIWALEAPFEHKDLLKRRGYRWSPGGGGRPRAWYTEVAEEEAETECAWLKAAVYGGRGVRYRCERRDARSRYSTER